ncbi:unnamed protein product, partial [Rotaria sordida]
MNPSKDLHSSSYLVRETFIVPKDDQDINLVPERKNVQQKRNTEYLIQVLYKLKFSEEECISRFSASFENQVDSSSQQRNSESLWKTWKYRLALARTTQERSEALKFLSSYKDKSNSCHHLPTFNELQTEHDNHDSKDARSVSQLQVDKIESDPSFQKNQIRISRKSKSVKKDKNVIKVKEQLNLSEDTNQKALSLEEKLANNRELNIIGIMNLSSMNLTDNDMLLVIEKIFGKHKTKCTGFIFRDNALTSIGMKMFVDAILATRMKLKYLNLSNNLNIGDAGIEHVVYLFKKSRSINFLALSNTGITDRGVRLLADLLCDVDADTDSCCSSLEKLYLSFNTSITDESMEALLQIIEQNRTLKLLSVQYCSLSDQARQLLRET